MTKHVHMGPPTATLGSPTTGRSEHSRSLPAWFLFAVLVGYAATVGFGDNSSFASLARIDEVVSERWEESMERAPRVLTPLREQGWSVLLHHGAQGGSASVMPKDSTKNAAQPMRTPKTP